MEHERSLIAGRLLRRMQLDDLRALRQGLVALATAQEPPCQLDPLPAAHQRSCDVATDSPFARLGSVVILAVVLLFSAGIWAATQLQQDLLAEHFRAGIRGHHRRPRRVAWRRRPAGDPAGS